VLTNPVIIFDGVCRLCNGFINFIIKHDRKKIFRFATLQGNFYKSLSETLATDQQSVILYTGDKIFTKSDAALKILAMLGYPFRAAAILFLIPAPFRNAIYSIISRYRFSWFGKTKSCRMPGKDEEKLFIG
jgi:predicted DCC family thiol-disulfide oxidoreductase YuxK